MKTFAMIVFLVAASFRPQLQAQSQFSQPAGNDASMLERGKQIFTNRCGKCHDADAAKKLPDGTTLLTRLTTSKDTKALLSTRLKKMSEQDARAVDFYLEDLIARFRSQNADQTSH